MTSTANYPTITAEGRERLDKYLHEHATSGQIPAMFLGATTAEDEIYFGSEGDRYYGEPDKGKVDGDTTLQLFSMTKFMTTLACMIGIDKGLLDLHDPSCVEKYCPELCAQKILKGYSDDGKAIYADRTQPIRLWHLLTHTAGLSYTWNEPMIDRWRKENGSPKSLFHVGVETFIQPLLFEPGTHFKYSIGMDWAGICIARAAGMTLEEVMQEWIFKPCGVTSITFHPTKQVKDRLMGMMFRQENNGPLKNESQLPKDGHRLTNRPWEEDQVGPIYMGGGGLFGSARDYLKVLKHVLASDPDRPKTKNAALLKPDSFKKLFIDITGGNPDVQRDMATMTAEQYQHDEELLDGGKGTYFGHGPGLFLNLIDEKDRRKKNSGDWDGAAKTMFWIDPTTGIAGVCCTNLLSQNPDPWNMVYINYEKTLYAALG